MPNPLQARRGPEPGPGQKPRPPRRAELAGRHLSWHFDIRFSDNGNVCDRILKTSSTCHRYDIILIQMKAHCFCFLICPRWHVLDGLGQSCEQWVTSWQKCQNWFPWLFKDKHTQALGWRAHAQWLFARTVEMSRQRDCWVIEGWNNKRKAENTLYNNIEARINICHKCLFPFSL